jgi:cyclopropane fatty-acyl-phospholipid synthase-like methyltransferase
VQRIFFYFWYLFSKPPWDTGIPAPELVRALADRPAGRALDLGCGTGTNVRYLVEHGWQATGLDFVPAAIAQAQRRLRPLTSAEPPDLRVADVTRLKELDFPGPFDLALDMGCFHSLTPEGQKRYALGLAHWMKPGGRYLLYARQPAPDGRGLGLAREAVEAAFAPGFRLADYEQGRPSRQGGGWPSAWYYFDRNA